MNSNKPRTLWNNPKVVMQAEALVIEGKYFPYHQTRGAFVEIVPAKPVDKNAPAAPEVKKPATFGSIMKGIGMVFLIIFLIAFSVFLDNNDYGSGGSNQPFRLVLNSDFGRTVVLEHTNRKKLNKIAEEVNKKLMAQGRQPQTNGFEAAGVTR